MKTLFQINLPSWDWDRGTFLLPLMVLLYLYQGSFTQSGGDYVSGNTGPAVWREATNRVRGATTGIWPGDTAATYLS